MTAEGISCPYCDAHDNRIKVKRIDEKYIYECQTCGLQFLETTVIPNYDLNYFVKAADLSTEGRTGYKNYYELGNEHFYWQELLVLISKGHNHLKHLDIGCATGKLSGILESHEIIESYGIDVSREAVAEGIKTGVKLRKASISELRDIDIKFDIITAFDVLEHSLDIKLNLNVIKEALTNDGVFIFSTPDCTSDDAQFFKEEYPGYKESLEHVLFFGKTYLRKAIKDIFQTDPIIISTINGQYNNLIVIVSRAIDNNISSDEAKVSSLIKFTNYLSNEIMIYKNFYEDLRSELADIKAQRDKYIMEKEELITRQKELEGNAIENKRILALKEHELNLIHKSDFWKIALKYYRFRDHVWPFNKIFHFIKERNLRKNQKNYNASINDFESNLSIEPKSNFIFSANYNKPDIIILSIIDWEFRFQRPQHIAKNLATQGHRVYYVNANFSNMSPKQQVIDDRLHIITMHSHSLLRIYDATQYTEWNDTFQQLEELIEEHKIRDCVILVDYPSWFPLVQNINKQFNFRVVFDYMDDFTGFNTTNETLICSTEEVLKSSHRVITTSQYLYEKAQVFSDQVSVVRNGTDYKHFNKPSEPKSQRPRVGYYGAIAEWFDMEKVIYIAQQRPDWDIILIGDYTYANTDDIKEFPNIYLLGEKDYSELPEYLCSFDVCIIPFKTDSDLIRATNPVKFYEYLSAGKKIVATVIPELCPYADQLVYLTNSNEEFVQYIQSCLNNEDTLVSTRVKMEFARGQDWEERVKMVEQIITNAYDLVSIIIVTFNNFSYSRQCIESVLNSTAYPNYEVIIVDNKSLDGTADYLKELDLKYERIRVILNLDNFGFAKANNIGIENSKGRYVILLNNDTVVTRGWVTTLVKHLERNDRLGLIGPVTNSIGNEAKINVTYQSISEMDEFADSYCSRNRNLLSTDLDVLAMFCVGMRREIIEEVGYLDESFGIGMFEDDDFSYRVKEKGYFIACAEDVFIHHYGGVSFKKLKDESYDSLFNKNKELFERKWGIRWIPHGYRKGVV